MCATRSRSRGRRGMRGIDAEDFVIAFAFGTNPSVYELEENMSGANRVVCFIDDDPAELRRFEMAMKSEDTTSPRFTCVTATTYEDCKNKLNRENLAPDLWVLDLFFPSPGVVNSREQLEQM